MDKTDITLCQLLLGNSRLSYRELAEKLDLSITAVHNRIQALIDIGIIRKFTAKPSMFSQNVVNVLIYGSSKIASISGLKEKIETNKSIYWTAIAGGNVVYVGVYLKIISDLESVAHFVKETVKVTEPTVGLTMSPIPFFAKNPKVQTALCDLDYKIICSLKDDSRKATSIVAEEIGISAKTVRNRLKRMMKNYLIELSIEWYPDASNDIMSIFHIKFKDEANPDAPNLILQKHYPNTLFYWSLSNLPGNYVFMVWSQTSKEVKEISESLEREPSVEVVAPNIIYTGYIFPTWRDQYP